MSKTTHTANSPEPGSGWDSDDPPGWSAAAMSEAAAPPEAFPLGEAWGREPAGDVGARCTTTGLDTPDRLGSDPNGTPEYDDPPGWDAAAISWAAAPPVKFQLLEAWRTEANRRGAPGHKMHTLHWA